LHRKINVVDPTETDSELHGLPAAISQLFARNEIQGSHEGQLSPRTY